MDCLINIGTSFIVYSFLGWILEDIYKTILDKKITNSGFLYGPFCPIYGLGAIIAILTLEMLRNKYLLLFIISTIEFSLLEYIIAIILEKIFKVKYWDYTSYKYNFQGRICLKNSMFWGILGLVFIQLINPIMQMLIMKVSLNIKAIFIIIFAFYLIIDIIFTMKKIKKERTTNEKY